MAMPAPGGTIHHGPHEEGGKRNPLVDLIDSERIYVDQLGLVIRVSLSASSTPGQAIRHGTTSGRPVFAGAKLVLTARRCCLVKTRLPASEA